MTDQRILQKLRELVARDRSDGGVRPLSKYQALLGSRDESIAAEYRRLTDGERDAPRVEAETLAAPPLPTSRPPGASDSELETRVGPPSTPSPSTPATASRPAARESTSSGAIPGLLDEGQRRFVEEGEVARGGMGAIVRLWDDALDRELAKKLILPAGAGRPDLVARFVEEARVTAQLSHPGVVPVHDVGVDDQGRLFFTMKLVAGRTFEDVIGSVRDDADPDWNLQRAVQTFLRICETLAFAHSSGVIHRDLKPANVMVGDFGEVYVMDWGLAKVVGRADGEPEDKQAERPKETQPATDRTDASDSTTRGRKVSGSRSEATMVGSVVGTPTYMPPEQARGEVDALDERSDIYSLGAILYELLAGEAPYSLGGKRTGAMATLGAVIDGPPQPLAELATEAPPELVAIAEKAMTRDPAGRYPKAEALRRDLEDFLEGRVVRAYRTGPLVELRKWVLRNKAVASTAAAGLVAVAALGIWFSRFSVEVERERTDKAREHAREVEQERAETEEALIDARALGLVAASASEWRADPLLSLLLARAALRMRVTPETIDGIQKALRRPTERMRLVAHETRNVTCTAFSPDGRLLAASAGETVRLWDAAGRELAVLRRPPSPERPRFTIMSVWFTADSRRLVAAATDGDVRIWSVDGRELAALSVVGNGHFPNSLQVLPDGASVIVGDKFGTTHLFDSLTGDPQVKFDGHTKPIYAVAVSPDGTLVATGSGDGTARIWSRDGSELAVLRGHDRHLHCIAFTPDGKFVVTGSRDMTARVWDLGGEQRAVLRGHRTHIMDVEVSPDGTQIATSGGGPGSTIRLWSLDGTPVRTLSAPRGVHAPHGAMYFRDGARILSGSRDKSMRIWDEYGVELARMGGHVDSCRGARSPDGRLVLTSSSSPLLRVWSVDDHRSGVLRAPDSTFIYTAASPDGTLVAATSYSRSTPGKFQLLIWGPTGEVASRLTGHTGGLAGVAWSPRGARLLSWAADQTLRLSTASGELVAILKPDSADPSNLKVNGVAHAAFSPDGTAILAVTDRCLAHIWDGDGRPLASLGDAAHVASAAEWSPSGALIATAGVDGTARLFDRDGVEVAVLRGHTDAVTYAAFSPDGQSVLTTSADETARLWDLDGTQRAVISGEQVPRGRVQYSPDGSRILSGMKRHWSDRLVDNAALWDAECGLIATFPGADDEFSQGTGWSPDGTLVMTQLPGNPARVWTADGEFAFSVGGPDVVTASFTPNGREILTTDRRSVERWLVSPIDLMAAADDRAIRDFTPEERERFRRLLGPDE